MNLTHVRTGPAAINQAGHESWHLATSCPVEAVCSDARIRGSEVRQTCVCSSDSAAAIPEASMELGFLICIPGLMATSKEHRKG